MEFIIPLTDIYNDNDNDNDINTPLTITNNNIEYNNNNNNNNEYNNDEINNINDIISISKLNDFSIEKNSKNNIKKTTKKIPKIKNIIYFSYIEYFEDIKDKLSRYKLVELKEIAKIYKLKNLRTKNEYITKIHNHFIKIKNAIIIQKICRGFFVRYFFKINGGMLSFNNRNQCVNDSDFYTLEPLSEIDFCEFFRITDNKNFSYGFNIKSLITMYKKNGSINNPYNRNSISIEIIQNIFSYYQLLCILFKDNALEEDRDNSILATKIPRKQQINSLFISRQYFGNHHTNNTNNRIEMSPSTDHHTNIYSSLTTTTPTTTTIQLYRPQYISQITSLITPNIRPERTHILNTEDTNNIFERLEELRHKMLELRRMSFETRVNELFMYIDQLGNYTVSEWFLNLSKREYYIFYSQLRELWVYRGEIPSNVKILICPLGDPFIESSTIIRKPYNEITDIEICNCCLNVIENMILTSLDTEYRRIGCLHVLTALTVVSIPARIQYGYLYDSII